MPKTPQASLTPVHRILQSVTSFLQPSRHRQPTLAICRCSGSSFNNAPKRIQNGGWARQVTQADFAIAETISGVDMRLTAGGIREMHWHLAAEWGFVSYGNCRVTILDEAGRAYVADVTQGDVWYFPAGLPHSLQGLDPDGCEFLLAFDDGKATEFNTLLLTD